MSYMELYASLEVPAVLPPERSQQASPELAYSGAAAHIGTSASQFGQSSQLVSPNSSQRLQLSSPERCAGACLVMIISSYS